MADVRCAVIQSHFPVNEGTPVEIKRVEIILNDAWLKPELARSPDVVED